MPDNPKFELDCKNRKLTLKGACLDLLDICKGMCCRKWNVPIQESEYAAGAYKAKKVCIIDGNNCAGERPHCINRQYRLDQKEDGSCVYLNEDSTCSIYERRPLVCRNFTCKNGWEISSTCPTPPQQQQQTPKESSEPETHKTYEASPAGDMTYIANPLVRLKTVFYAKDKKKLSLVVKPMDKCSLTTCTVDFDYPSLNEDILRQLIGLFDGTATLDAARAQINEKCNLRLTAGELSRIVQLLQQRGIIIFKNEE
jgi:Fe-S-cluster containining protein